MFCGISKPRETILSSIPISTAACCRRGPRIFPLRDVTVWRQFNQNSTELPRSLSSQGTGADPTSPEPCLPFSPSNRRAEIVPLAFSHRAPSPSPAGGPESYPAFCCAMSAGASGQSKASLVSVFGAEGLRGALRVLRLYTTSPSAIRGSYSTSPVLTLPHLRGCKSRWRVKAASCERLFDGRLFFIRTTS